MSFNVKFVGANMSATAPTYSSAVAQSTMAANQVYRLPQLD
jgi:hypothetical protein